MEYERKRLLSFIIVGGYLFLGGCEYAVILPTCMSYLKSLGATNEYWLGFTISAYSFSAAISGVIGGRLSDIYEYHTKTIAMVSIVLMIFGSLQYTVGMTVWNVFISRLVCGCGTAAGSAMLAEVCRVTAVDERTPILAICNATRQLGILVGPIFQLILTYFVFDIGPFPINPLNAPGIFMAGLWLIFLVMTYFMFYNLTWEMKLIKRQQRRANMAPMAMQRAGPAEVSPSSRAPALPISEELPEIPEDEVTSGPSLGHQITAQRAIQDCLETSGTGSGFGSQSVAESSISQSQSRKSRILTMSERFMTSLAQSGQKSTGVMSMLYASGISLADRSYLREFMRDYFILMLSMVFTLFFCQVGLETIVPVVIQDYFGYGEFENSLVYMTGGAEALVVFFAVAFISRYVRDTNLMIVGWICLTTAHVWLLVFLPQFQVDGTGSAVEVTIFMIGLVMMYFGYAVSSVANTGLYSKCLSTHTQGLGQGLRRMFSYLGLIFGPTWAGANVRKPYRYLGVPLGIISMNAMMLIASFGDLRDIENEHRDRDTLSIFTSVDQQPQTPQQRRDRERDEERRQLLR